MNLSNKYLPSYLRVPVRQSLSVHVFISQYACISDTRPAPHLISVSVMFTYLVCLCLLVCPRVCLSCFSVHLLVSFCLFICMPIYFFPFKSACGLLCVSPCRMCLSVGVSFLLFSCRSPCVCVSSSVCLHCCFLACLSICPSVSACLSATSPHLSPDAALQQNWLSPVESNPSIILKGRHALDLK